MERPDIKAVFFDIDGTLIDHEHGSVLPESARRSLFAMHEKGIKLFIATGRIHYMVHVYGLEGCPFDGFVALNGQYVMDKDGNVIHRMYHRPEAIRALMELLKTDDFPALIIEEEDSYGTKDCEQIRNHFRWCGFDEPKLYDISRLDDHPVLQFLAYLPWAERGRLASIPYIEPTSAGGNILDIVPEGGGKDAGIAATAKYYGFSRENIMVFGDGVNDISMIRWAGIGVAMGNAREEAVKAAADYVTTHVGEDGIKNALLHFGVLGEEDFR